jgi:hypothetical protein
MAHLGETFWQYNKINGLSQPQLTQLVTLMVDKHVQGRIALHHVWVDSFVKMTNHKKNDESTSLFL